MSYQRLYAAVTACSRADIRSMVVGHLLADIVDGRSALRAVRHPLGFACLPVLRDGDEGICVHVWESGRGPASLTTEPYHCHSWDLLSHILYGTVGNQPVEVTDGTTYVAFEARSTAQGDRLVDTGRLVDARELPCEWWAEGETYALAAGHFHQSVIGDGSAAASVVLGKHLADGVNITLGHPGQETREDTKRVRCSIEETRRLAELVRGRIAPLAAAAAT